MSLDEAKKAKVNELLQRGASTLYGRICYPFEARAIRPLLMEMRDSGLLFWGENGETPIITDAGRAAVGGKTATELLRAELRAAQW